MTLEQNTQRAEDAIVKLVPPFWGKPNIASMLLAYIEQTQELEDACWDVMTSRLLANATGPRLKTIGRIVGQPAFDFSEAEHRALIAVRVALNRTHTHATSVREIFELLAAGDPDLNYTVSDRYPACVLVFAESEIAGKVWRATARDLKAAGVSCAILISSPVHAQFLYDDPGGAVPDVDYGFGSAPSPVGGVFAGVYAA